MGRLVARAACAGATASRPARLILIDPDCRRARQVGAELRRMAATGGGSAYGPWARRPVEVVVGGAPEAAAGADAVLIVTPPAAVPGLVRELRSLLAPGALLAGCATAVSREEMVAAAASARADCRAATGSNGAAPDGDGGSWTLRVAAVKIIGEARQMERGGEAAVALDVPDEAARQVLFRLLAPLGPVLRCGDPGLSRVNRLAAAAAVDAARVVERSLAGTVPPDVLLAAVRTVAAGTLAGYPWDPPDGFMAGVLASRACEPDGGGA